MSIFSAIGKAITGPFRGIGNMLQGKFRKGIGAFGDVAKVAGPILTATGVGAPIGVPLTAGGAAASRWGEGGGFGDVVGAGAGGAASALAMPTGGGPLPHITNFLNVGEGYSPMPHRTVSGSRGGLNFGGYNPVPSTPSDDGGGGILGDIGRFIGKNPEVVTSGLGTILDVYGAAKNRQILRRELDIEEQELRKRRDMDRMRMILQAMTAGI